ncbi:MAG: hypothetical protein ACXADY_09885 [Candidatus Hodarchaeales archaeon]
MNSSLNLNELLPETEEFPVGSGIKVIRGKTLTRTSTWWKAVVLVKLREKNQLRFYGWQKNKEGQYKVRQKFNVSKGYSTKLAKILIAFSMGQENSDE